MTLQALRIFANYKELAMKLTLGIVLLEKLVRSLACGAIGKSPDVRHPRDDSVTFSPLVVPEDATGMIVCGNAPKILVKYMRVENDADRREASRLEFTEYCDTWEWVGNAWISDGSLLICGERSENGNRRGCLVEAELEL